MIRLRSPRLLRRLWPRSLRRRLVLIAALLATCAVVLCQVAGQVVLRTWLVEQVDSRLDDFGPPSRVYEDVAHGTIRHGSENILPSDYRVFFYDGDGRLMKRSLGQSGAAAPQLPSRVSELGLADGRPATWAAGDGGSGADWRVLAHTGPGHMRAVVALPLDTVDAATTKFLWFSIGLGVVVAVGVVLCGNAAVRFGLRPLTRVERTAQSITAGDLGLNVPVSHPDTEVGRLGVALNTMLDQLRTALHRTEDSERRMRRFMADAGHELRTPLTAIQGFAELLLDHPEVSDPAQRHEAHTLIARNAERMSRLVDELFLLAKLGDAPRPRREPVDLLSLAADAITTTALRHPHRSIALEPLGDRPDRPGQDLELDVVEADGDPHQLARVVGNLLANACTHTPPDSRVRVRVGATRSGPRTGGVDVPGRVSPGPQLPTGMDVCVIEVVDDGDGLDPADARHVFDRFYRAVPAAAHGAEPGSGLGLAIAAAIATAHGGRLELDSRPGDGCTFRLLLRAGAQVALEPAGADQGIAPAGAGSTTPPTCGS